MMPTNYMQLLGGNPGLLPQRGGATGVTGDPNMGGIPQGRGQGQLGGIPLGNPQSGGAYQGVQMPMGGQGWGGGWAGGGGMHPIIHHILGAVLHGSGMNPNMHGPQMGRFGQGQGMGGLPIGNPTNPQTQMFLQYLSQILGQR